MGSWAVDKRFEEVRGEKSSTGGLLVRRALFHVGELLSRASIVQALALGIVGVERQEGRKKLLMSRWVARCLNVYQPSRQRCCVCVVRCGLPRFLCSGLRSYSCRLISRTAWHTYDTRAVARCLVSFAFSLLFLFSCSFLCWSCLNAIRHHFRLCCPSEGDPPSAGQETRDR